MLVMRSSGQRYRLCATLLALADPSLAATPQTTEPVADARGTMQNIAAKPAAAKKSDLLVVPIPQSSPSLGTGVTGVGALFYNPNGSKESWTTGAAVMATSNGSRAAGVGLRWQASKETPINLRVNYARGKDSEALYISVGEAFWMMQHHVLSSILLAGRRNRMAAAPSDLGKP